MSDQEAPARVDVMRGDLVESSHGVSVCVVDGDGGTVLMRGDTETPVFPRSAIKAIQALPLLESGAADALGLTDQELALACSSHSAEAAHVATARSILAKAGCDEAVLECGGHWARRIPVIQEQ
ncbi:MAG: asparaginase, partial [Pseudomonadota bacterium]